MTNHRHRSGLADTTDQFFAVSPSNAAKRIGVPPLSRIESSTLLVGLSIVSKLVGSIVRHSQAF
eukprot:CAMPEP_0201142726 /NCGR_PEP_ID=MMETSP0851-20130426/4414_1 /ASSEMBLY_ACC=CAM_ASM_000631 /TAXON_ID=183588 /ORGANISM="Pseudo-nitzschia fraudulenta, Strain WWA7" /LENGTH=63 /DNA_ID=CAMNT_0047416531 /DNA_START=40 /DNA_END=228 /DNA_ORIENTATION=-